MAKNYKFFYLFSLIFFLCCRRVIPRVCWWPVWRLLTFSQLHFPLAFFVALTSCQLATNFAHRRWQWPWGRQNGGGVSLGWGKSPQKLCSRNMDHVAVPQIFYIFFLLYFLEAAKENAALPAASRRPFGSDCADRTYNYFIYETWVHIHPNLSRHFSHIFSQKSAKVN